MNIVHVKKDRSDTPFKHLMSSWQFQIRNKNNVRIWPSNAWENGSKNRKYLSFPITDASYINKIILDKWNYEQFKYDSKSSKNLYEFLIFVFFMKENVRYYAILKFRIRFLGNLPYFTNNCYFVPLVSYDRLKEEGLAVSLFLYFSLKFFCWYLCFFRNSWCIVSPRQWTMYVELGHQ